MLRHSHTVVSAALVLAVSFCGLPSTEAGRSLSQHLAEDASIERAVDLVSQVKCPLQLPLPSAGKS